MAQSRRGSLVEAIFNTVISFLTAVVTQTLLYPFYGIQTTVAQNTSIAFVFMAVSMGRQYVLRRLFNWLGAGNAK